MKMLIVVAFMAAFFMLAPAPADIIGPEANPAEQTVIQSNRVTGPAWSRYSSALRAQWLARRLIKIENGWWVSPNRWVYHDFSEWVPENATHIFLTGGFRLSSPYGDTCTQVITFTTDDTLEEVHQGMESTWVMKQHTRTPDASFSSFLIPLDDNLGSWIYWRTQGFSKNERCSYSVQFRLNYTVIE